MPAMVPAISVGRDGGRVEGNFGFSGSPFDFAGDTFFANPEVAYVDAALESVCNLRAVLDGESLDRGEVGDALDACNVWSYFMKVKLETMLDANIESLVDKIFMLNTSLTEVIADAEERMSLIQALAPEQEPEKPSLPALPPSAPSPTPSQDDLPFPTPPEYKNIEEQLNPDSVLLIKNYLSCIKFGDQDADIFVKDIAQFTRKAKAECNAYCLFIVLKGGLETLTGFFFQSTLCLPGRHAFNLNKLRGRSLKYLFETHYEISCGLTVARLVYTMPRDLLFDKRPILLDVARLLNTLATVANLYCTSKFYAYDTATGSVLEDFNASLLWEFRKHIIEAMHHLVLHLPDLLELDDERLAAALAGTVPRTLDWAVEVAFYGFDTFAVEVLDKCAPALRLVCEEPRTCAHVIRTDVWGALARWLGADNVLRDAAVDLLGPLAEELMRTLTSGKDGGVWESLGTSPMLYALLPLLEKHTQREEVLAAVAGLFFVLAQVATLRFSIVELGGIKSFTVLFMAAVQTRFDDHVLREWTGDPKNDILFLTTGILAHLMYNQPDPQIVEFFDCVLNENSVLTKLVTMAKNIETPLGINAIKILVHLCKCQVHYCRHALIQSGVTAIIGKSIDHYIDGSVYAEHSYVFDLHVLISAAADLLKPMTNDEKIAVNLSEEYCYLKNYDIVEECDKVGIVNGIFQFLENRDHHGLDILEESVRALSCIAEALLANRSGLLAKYATRTLTILTDIIIQKGDANLLTLEHCMNGIVVLARHEALQLPIVNGLLARCDKSKHALNSYFFYRIAQAFRLTGEKEIMTFELRPRMLAEWFLTERSLLIQNMAIREIINSCSLQWEEPLSQSLSQEEHGDVKNPPLSFTEIDEHSLYVQFAKRGGTDLLDEDYVTEHRQRTLKDHMELTGQIPTCPYHIGRQKMPFDSHRHLNDRRTSLRKMKQPASRDLSAHDSDYDSSVESHSVSEFNEGEPFVRSSFDFLIKEDSFCDWIIQHASRFHPCNSCAELIAEKGVFLPERVQTVLHRFLPSSMLQSKVCPLSELSPGSSFEFRTLTMPEREFKEFHYMGKIMKLAYDKQCSLNKKNKHCHWSLLFVNSTFRGTFVRNLRRVLNSCLLIQTLIFARDNYAEVPQESTALVDLVSLLPSGIKSIVFDNVLDVKSFQQIFDNHDLRLEGIAVKNSPHLRKLKPNLFSMWTQNFGQLGNDLRCSLTWFDLSGNDLGDDICAKIMKAVCIDGAFPVLEQLSLSGNEIREGTQMIKVFQTLQNVGLCKNKLKQLDLSCNELGWWDEARAERKGGDVAVEIMSLLANCTFPLRSLDLSENNLGNRNFVHACSASIRSNRTLMELNLNQNSISGPSAKILIESMNKMKTLCYLRLEGNKLPISADLKSQLQLVQLKSRSKKVQEFSQKPLSTNMNGNHPSVGDQTVGYSQICVLQAAPLVFISLRGTVTPAPPPLNFSKEKEVFKECFKKSALKMDIATTARLQECLNTKARVLHYSGHGSPHHLYFENGAGVGQQLGHQQLKKIAVMAGVGQDSSDGIQLVFVSACHSYQSGKAFVDAGVKHVICCKYEATVLDEAAIRFTKQLYTALISGCTVQNSFNQALLAIEIAPKIGAQDRDLEMEKYLLLPQEGDHDVNIFDDSDGVGRNDDDHIIDDDITFSRLPVPCKGFLGREVDLMNIIDAILDEHRFINVIGASGIGKSSIMAAACQYIYERKSDMKKSSIIYLQNDVLSCEKTFSKSNPILSSLHQEMVNHELIDARTLPFDETMEDILEDRMFSILNKRKSLLVLDLGPALEKEEDGRLSTFCERILSKGINVLVLVVTVKPLEMNVNRVLKKEIVLGGFSLEASSKLLTDNCTFQQVKDTMQKNRLRDFICLKKISKSRKKAILQFLGKGLPVKIIKLASEMNKFKLRKLIYNCIIPRGEWIEEDCMILLSSLIDAIIKWIQNGDTLNFMNSITMYGLFCKLFHDKEGIERLIQFFSLTESNATCSKSKEILNEIMSTLRGGNPIIICNLAFAKEKGDIFHTFVAAGLHILVQKGLRKNHDVNGEKDWIVEGSIPTNEGDLNGVGV